MTAAVGWTRGQTRSLEHVEASIGGRVARVLAVLAIALGVLAMHALSGGHHGGVPVIPATTGSVAAHDVAGPLHGAEHHLLAAAAATAAPLQDVAGGCDGECSERSSGLLLLCMAVMLAAASALALRLESRTRRTAARSASAPGGRARTTAPGRPLDLVADLCISRT